MGNLVIEESVLSEIFTDDNQLDDYCMLEDILKDAEYTKWPDDDGGEEDKPTRLWINNKYLIEFTVGSGECIESSWDCRIWSGEAIDLKLIEVKH